jgi:hypothetical protein
MRARSGHRARLSALPQTAEQASPPTSIDATASLAKRALGSILTLIGGALIALAGAWLVFVGGPPVGSSSPTDSSGPLITARAIREPTPGYHTPSLTGKSVALYIAGESLTFTGYCIGPPAPSVEVRGTDERWLIRANGILVPAGDLARYSTQALPVPCPGQKTPQGPQVLAPNAQPTLHGTLIHATLAHASIVGLALYRPQTKSWEQVAKRIVSDGRLTVPIAARRHAAVILAACWANGVPALRPTPGNYVARVIGLPGTSGNLTGTAIAATPQGALKACGPLPKASGVKTPSIPRERNAKPAPPQLPPRSPSIQSRSARVTSGATFSPASAPAAPTSCSTCGNATTQTVPPAKHTQTGSAGLPETEGLVQAGGTAK